MREVTSRDLDLIADCRRRMFIENGHPTAAVEAADSLFREWLQPHLDASTYFGWVIEQEGRAIASCGMMAIEWPPHPLHPREAKRGYVLNVYVEPEHRGRGHARALMERCREEARRRGLGYLILHATVQGRPLYEKLGWASTTEMALVVAGQEL